MPRLLKTILLVSSALAISAAAQAQTPNIAGIYTNPDGGRYTITATAIPGQYMLQGTDPSNDSWEGIGFYSDLCKCLKSTFRFTDRAKWKDGVGFHVFEVSEAGKKLTMKGGWSAPSEWGPAASTKAQ